MKKRNSPFENLKGLRDQLSNCFLRIENPIEGLVALHFLAELNKFISIIENSKNKNRLVSNLEDRLTDPAVNEVLSTHALIQNGSSYIYNLLKEVKNDKEHG